MAIEEKNERRSTILFLGDSLVGKSALTNLYSCFPLKEIEPSVAGDYQTIKIKDQQGKEHVFGVLGTSGKKEYRPIIKTILKSSQQDIYFIAFDLSNKTSFNNVYAYIAMLKDHITDPVILIIANKSDLKSAITLAEFKELSSKTQLPILTTTIHKPESMKAVFLSVKELIKKHQEKKQSEIKVLNKGFLKRHYLKMTFSGLSFAFCAAIFEMAAFNIPNLQFLANSLLAKAVFFISLKGAAFIGGSFLFGGLSVAAYWCIAYALESRRHPKFIDNEIIEPKESIKNTFDMRMSFMGSKGAGKTSLIKAAANLTTDNIPPTEGAAFQQVKLKHNSQLLTLMIKDFSGDNKKYLKAILPMLKQVADIYVIAFDVTQKLSYEMAVKYIALLRKIIQKPLIMLVATKLDDLSNRIVTDKDIEELRKKTQLPIVKTSIKNKKSVEDLFFHAHEMVVNVHKEPVVHFRDIFFKKHAIQMILGGVLTSILSVVSLVLLESLPSISLAMILPLVSMDVVGFIGVFFFTGVVLSMMLIKAIELTADLIGGDKQKPMPSSTKKLAEAGLLDSQKAPFVKVLEEVTPSMPVVTRQEGVFQEASPVAIIRP